MITLYSQHDPSYDRLKLGDSNLTIHGYGCFLTSLANLFQKSPVELLKIKGGINADGLLIASVIAKECGGEYLGQAQTGEGWQIAQTDHYTAQGFPTHFFCVNLQTKQQIDPLKFPAIVEPLKYKIVNVRVFKGQVLKPEVIQPIPVGPFPDVAPDRWSAPAIEKAKFLKWIDGYPDGTFKPEKPMTREEVVALVVKIMKV